MVTARWKRNDEPFQYKQGVDGIAVIKGDAGPCIYVVTDGNDSTLITQLVTVLESHLAIRNGTRQVLSGGTEFAIGPDERSTFGSLSDAEGKPLRWQSP
jgi:hypothetical protein